MKKLVLGLVFTLAFTTMTSAQDKKTTRPEVAQYCKVFTSNENLQVTTTRIGKAENNEILFEIVGIDHPFDKKIFKAKVDESNDGISITIKYEGDDWVIATKRGDNSWYNDFTVYLPNKGKKMSEYTIFYSKEISNQCKPEWLLTAYLEQK
jgi:hypothetical protein